MDRHHRNKKYHMHHQHKRDPKKGDQVVTEVVYVTLEPTFTGPIGGYSTITIQNQPQQTATDKSGAKQTSSPSPNPKSTSSPSPSPSSTEIAESSSESEQTNSSTRSHTTFSTATLKTGLGSKTTTSTSTATSTGITDGQDGSQGGSANVAGIAGGVIAGVLAVLLIAAFFYRRRKQKIMNEAYQKPEEEKFAAQGAGPGHSSVVPPVSPFDEKAPRVSLRPVTQFNMPDIQPAAASPIVRTGPGHEISRKPIPAPLSLSKPPMSDMVVVTPASSHSSLVAVPAAAPSPTLSAFSDGAPATPASVDAANLVAGGKPAPVFRVQMDYVPQQPDELEIRVGSLVRMLHEYDDGWALCIRMDRSQQGVCPRTCLSARPVKPRPAPAPGARPAPPARNGPGPANGRTPYPANQGPTPPPNFANQPRPQSPAGRPGRPQTPTQRPQTPKTPVPQITVSLSEDHPSRPQTPVAQAPEQQPTEQETAQPQPAEQPTEQQPTEQQPIEEQPSQPAPATQQTADGPVFHAM